MVEGISLADAGPFSAEEVSAVRAIVPVATKALCRALGRVLRQADSEPPAVIMLDAAGAITTMTAGARRVLDESRCPPDDGDLPAVVRAAATRPAGAGPPPTSRRGCAAAAADGCASTSTRSKAMWAPCRFSSRPPVPPTWCVVLESYALTDRERDIMLLLAGGLSRKEIAAEPVISEHTGRDHVKAIDDKPAVNSRGELIAALFSNAIVDRFHARVTHVR